MYISLHNHSNISKFDGYSDIEDMAKRAKELGQHSIAITEHGTLSSIIPFYKQCKERNINPILGNEFYMCETVNIKERSQMYHLILLARSERGYYNLKLLDTLAYENLYYKPRIDMKMIEKYHEGLICLSACMGSILNTDSGIDYAKRFKNIFGDDFYLEFQSNSMSDQLIYNQKILSISKLLNIPLVVTSDAHYCRKEDAKYHRLWVNLNKGENNYYPTDDFWIHGESDIINELSDTIPIDILRSAIDNTERIARQCNVDISVSGNNYPIFPCDDKRKAVEDICKANWDKKLENVKPDDLQKYQERYEYEIGVLESCDYLNYLLITYDILDWCSNNNILTGLGRGSCGGSLVCYLMNITKVDPIKTNLMFERFVNPERITAADMSNVERYRNIAC